MSQSSLADRLSALGWTMPEPATASAYEGVVEGCGTLTTSGQLPLAGGTLVATGVLGRDVDVAGGQEAARHCVLNVLAQCAPFFDEGRIERLQKITVFVASGPGFSDQHLVANAASELFVEVLGDAGRHARSAIGVSGLPLNAAVEIEAVFLTG